VVGVKGTALTENQVNLLSRFTQKITFCFDGDKAGQEAIKRSLTVVEKKGLTPTVIEIPDGKDPDESLKLNSALFKKAVREDIGIYDYLLSRAIISSDVTTAAGKKQVSDLLLPLISHITNEIIKEHYLKKISNELDTSYDSINKEMQRLVRQESVKAVKILPKAKRNKEEVREEYLLALIIQNEHPKLLIDAAMTILSPVMTKERSIQKILLLLAAHFENTEQFDMKTYGDELAQELVSSYNTCLLFPLSPFDSDEKLLEEVVKKAEELKIFYIQQQMKKLAGEIKQKEEEGIEEDVDILKKNYSDLASLLNID